MSLDSVSIESNRAPHKFQNLRDRLSYLAQTLGLVWEASRGWTVAWLALLLAQGVLPAAIVYLTKVLVDGMAAAMGAGLSMEVVRPVLGPAILMAAVLVLGQMLQSLTAWIRTAQSELISDHIKALIHDQAGTIDLEYYETPAYFDQMNRASGQADSRSISLLENVGGMLQNSATMLAIAALLIPYGLWIPLALLASTLPALWAVVRHQRRYHTWWHNVTQKRRWVRYYDTLLTSANCAGEVRIFGLNGRFQNAYRVLRKQLREDQINLMRGQSAAQLGAGLLALLVTAASLAWMVWRSILGLATLGDIALFYQAFNKGQGLMRMLLSSVGRLYSDSLFLEHLFMFLRLEPKVKDPEKPIVQTPQLHHGIEIEGVSFRYPGSEQLALRDFSLFLPAGKIVAVVGPNGAGKSTLVKLLCRFYDPVAGRVLMDGVDIRDLEVKQLRERITALFQRFVNYAGTLEENIVMGNVEYAVSKERLFGAAEASGAHEFIERLPAGYDTLLGKQFEGGVELSWGQLQRLAIARTFYRQAPIVILDEPTSAMDPWAETIWLDRFCAQVSGRTVLLVTHRFSTAMRADLICVMDEGRVVEIGSHQELVEQDGLYAASWRAQKRESSEASQVEHMVRR